MGIFGRKTVPPDPDGPWTVVYALRVWVTARDGQRSHYEQRWYWTEGWETPTRAEAEAFAQRLQDDLAKRGRREPAWAYARVEDAQRLSRAVEAEKVVQWPAERWAEV